MNYFKNINLPPDFDPEERGRRAEENFRKGYNCCQSVLLAFADILESNSLATKDQIISLGSGFGGGMGRLREVCGSFSAAVLMSGFILPARNPGNMDERRDNYALVQEFASSFRQMNGGSIVCRELLGLSKKPGASKKPGSSESPQGSSSGTPETFASGALQGSSSGSPETFSSGALSNVQPSMESPMPSARTEEYYRKRPCGAIIASSALMIARKLQELQSTLSD